MDYAAYIRETHWFRQHVSALERITGMPVCLLSIRDVMQGDGSWEQQVPFCAAFHRSCKAIRNCQGRLLRCMQHSSDLSTDRPAKISCPAGLSIYAFRLSMRDADTLLLVAGRVLVRRADQESGQRFEQRLEQVLGRERPHAEEQAGKLAALIRVVEPARICDFLVLLQLLAERIQEELKRLLPDAHQAESRLVSQVRTLLKTDPQADLRLADVAARCDLSPSHFCRRFRQESGCCFSEYVSVMRVNMFMELLANSESTVADCAFGAGFQSISQANRAFRRQCGCCPSTYRSSLKTMRSEPAGPQP